MSIEAAYSDRVEKLEYDSILSSDVIGFKMLLKTKVLGEVYLKDNRICYKCKIEESDSSILKKAKRSFIRIMERFEVE